MLFVLAWLGLAVVVGSAASGRGRSGFGWFLLAVLISPLIGGILVAVLPDLKTRALIESLAQPGTVDDRALARVVRDGRQGAVETPLRKVKEPSLRGPIIAVTAFTVTAFGVFWAGGADWKSPVEQPPTKNVNSPSRQADDAPPKNVGSFWLRAPSVGLAVKSWHEGGFGTVAIATFAIRNLEEHAIKDVRFDCTFYAASGTQLGSRDGAILQKFAAKHTTTVRDFEVGFIPTQTASMSCTSRGAAWE